jgi:hypothetical protein
MYKYTYTYSLPSKEGRSPLLPTYIVDINYGVLDEQMIRVLQENRAFFCVLQDIFLVLNSNVGILFRLMAPLKLIL